MRLSDDQRAFRARARSVIAELCSDDARRAFFDPDEQDQWSPVFRRQFARRLASEGLIGVTWPAPYGDAKPFIYQTLLAEALERYAAPMIGRNLEYIPQAIIAFGDDEQKARFLPPLKRGELEIVLGYSEPEAGSDLAALQARAIRDGDTFRITGQKAYSSGAHIADYVWLAARTDPDAPKHRGISMFLIDMQSPGITVTADDTVAGWRHHAIALDDVVVPASALVGGLNQGWRVIVGALDAERAAFAATGLLERQLDHLLAFCRQPEPVGRRIDDPTVAAAIADLVVEAEAARQLSYQIADEYDHGRLSSAMAALGALTKREVARRIDAVALELLGPLAPLWRGAPGAVADGAFAFRERDHLYFHFAAGGFDINRTVIAQRGLGLPR
ncbi:MAG: acyl-CoA dehydrogenase family protein [Dehalococcoidia bacterium]|nr:acyl-CoA dehydrogenase family protein [Dehalococcoidia bacterium]